MLAVMSETGHAVFYLVAVILAVTAAVVYATGRTDSGRFASALVCLGFACFVFPFMVDAFSLS